MERRLGRGLGSLLGQQDSTEPDLGATDLPVNKIRPNPHQPRKVFESTHLEELRDSIKNHGVLQPICVRPADGGYEIISGERRWRASRLAGSKTIPAIVRAHVDDDQALELALVENVQRQDLDPMEKARGYQALIDRLALSQNQVAQRVGLKRSTVTNHLRLLELPSEVQDALSGGLVTMGHAKALLGLEDAGAIRKALAQIVRGDLSVRATEQLVKERTPKGAAERTETVRPAAPWVRELESRMRERLGVKAVLKNGTGYKGQIVIRYDGREELDRLCDVLAPKDEL